MTFAVFLLKYAGILVKLNRGHRGERIYHVSGGWGGDGGWVYGIENAPFQHLGWGMGGWVWTLAKLSARRIPLPPYANIANKTLLYPI